MTTKELDEQAKNRTRTRRSRDELEQLKQIIKNLLAFPLVGWAEGAGYWPMSDIRKIVKEAEAAIGKTSEDLREEKKFRRWAAEDDEI